jgi:hypothetical protein
MSDPHIKEAAALMEQAKGALASGASQLKGATENVDLQKLMPYLLAGGAGAVGGAALSGKRKERSGETRGQYLTRILRNAVAAGALTGAGTYAAAEGFKKTVGKVDLEHPITGKEGDQGPLAEVTRGTLFGAPAAIGAGALGLGLTVGRPGIGSGINDKALADAGDKLTAGLKAKFKNGLPPGIVDPGMDDLKALQAQARRDPAALRAAVGKDADLLHEAARLGINLHPKGLARNVQTAAHYPSLLMGRTPLRRVGRGALGLGAALIPAIAGSLLSDRPA